MLIICSDNDTKMKEIEWFMEWLIVVYIINRMIHGRLEIWNLSSSVHINIEGVRYQM